MSETSVVTDPSAQAQLEPNRAPIVLGLGLLSVALLLPVLLLELSMSGNAIALGRVADPSPLILRLLPLIPLWACVGLTFYFVTQHRRETTGAITMILVGLLCALFSIFCGFGLIQFALFPQG